MSPLGQAIALRRHRAPFRPQRMIKTESWTTTSASVGTEHRGPADCVAGERVARQKGECTRNLRDADILASLGDSPLRTGQPPRLEDGKGRRFPYPSPHPRSAARDQATRPQRGPRRPSAKLARLDPPIRSRRTHLPTPSRARGSHRTGSARILDPSMRRHLHHRAPPLRAVSPGRRQDGLFHPAALSHHGRRHLRAGVTNSIRRRTRSSQCRPGLRDGILVESFREVVVGAENVGPIRADSSGPLVLPTAME